MKSSSIRSAYAVYPLPATQNFALKLFDIMLTLRQYVVKINIQKGQLLVKYESSLSVVNATEGV